MIVSAKDITIENILNWSEETDSCICVDIDSEGNNVVLDDEDWSNFMKDNGAKFLKSDDECYYYQLRDRTLKIGVAFVSEDGDDVYLDIDNIDEI